MNAHNSSRSFNSFSLFLAALNFAVLDTFDAAFFARLDVDEIVIDFFRDRAVSFEVFFIAISRNVTQLRVDCEINLISFNHRYD